MMQRARTKAVSHGVSVLIPPMAGEAGQPAEVFGLMGLAVSPPLRVMTVAEKDDDERVKDDQRVLTGLPKKERERFLATMQLLCAVEIKDNEAIEKALLRLDGITDRAAKQIIKGIARSLDAERQARLLADQLNRELRGVRFVLAFIEGRSTPVPAIYCPRRVQGLYVRMLFKIGGTRGLGVCPHCGEGFEMRRPDQQYCSVAHREAHRVARWRAATRKAKGMRSKKRGKKKPRRRR